MIFNAFRNNSGFSDFHLRNASEVLRQLRNISGFYLRKFQKASRMILASSKNYQACAETNLT